MVLALTAAYHMLHRRQFVWYDSLRGACENRLGSRSEVSNMMLSFERSSYEGFVVPSVLTP